MCFFMDEFIYIFLAIGFLMTIWSWMGVKKKGPERRYPFWYRGLQLVCMAMILLPCLLVSVSSVSDSMLSFLLYGQIAAFGVLLFLDGTKSRFGKKVAEASENGANSRDLIMVLGAAATILMWAAVLYMFKGGM